MAIPFYSNTKAQTDAVLKACLLGLQQIEYKQLKHGFQFNVNCHWHVTLHHFTVLCLHCSPLGALSLKGPLSRVFNNALSTPILTNHI
jgi:hypothetical protein